MSKKGESRISSALNRLRSGISSAARRRSCVTTTCCTSAFNSTSARRSCALSLITASLVSMPSADGDGKNREPPPPRPRVATVGDAEGVHADDGTKRNVERIAETVQQQTRPCHHRVGREWRDPPAHKRQRGSHRQHNPDRVEGADLWPGVAEASHCQHGQ